MLSVHVQDAADRNKLGRSTFKNLNLALATIAAGNFTALWYVLWHSPRTTQAVSTIAGECAALADASLAAMRIHARPHIWFFIDPLT